MPNVHPELSPRRENLVVYLVLKEWYLTAINLTAYIVQQESFLKLGWKHVNRVTLANFQVKVKVTVVIVIMEWFPMTDSQVVFIVKLVPTRKVEIQHAVHA